MKVLGMGNALVDIIIQLPGDKLLDDLNLPKASMQLIDSDRLHHIQNFLKDIPQDLSSGGSAANTIHGLNALGVQTGFLGSVGRDSYGQFFDEDMRKKGIQTNFNYSDSPSGRAMALVSPDSERTFGTFLGAALELGPDHINQRVFEGFDLLHIEGYLVQNHDLIERAVKYARRGGLEVSIDMASYNVVEEHRDFLERILNDYVTIVFANEEEAKAMTGREPWAALEELHKMCGKAIVKIGKDGSLINISDRAVHVEAIKTTPVDTSGAGDIYAAGFLYGMSKDLSDIQCGQIGSVLSSKVIEFIGPKVPLQSWEEIIAAVKRIEALN